MNRVGYLVPHRIDEVNTLCLNLLHDGMDIRKSELRRDELTESKTIIELAIVLALDKASQG